ncbi:hypothetical protein Taro_040753 [Colocasia esculenta]|uniref:Uncharacterized protein n=1 Tax=Colocasia esculenta TaxID=4460 RepID=A0A843WRB7_COLES|nr:hypothetical protein [Colocasia esculenta]
MDLQLLVVGVITFLLGPQVQFRASKVTPTSVKESDGYAGMQSPARGAGGHEDDLSETEVAGSGWGKRSEQLREMYSRIRCSNLLLYSSALGFFLFGDVGGISAVALPVRHLQ